MCPATLSSWLSAEKYCSPRCKEIVEFGLPEEARLAVSVSGQSLGWYVARVDSKTFLWKAPVRCNPQGHWSYLDFAGVQQMDAATFSELGRSIPTVTYAVKHFVASEAEQLTESERLMQSQAAQFLWDAHGHRARAHGTG